MGNDTEPHLSSLPASSDGASILFLASAPYEVVWASPTWLHVCNYAAEHIIGHSLKTLQGPGTNQAAVAQLMSAVHECTPVSGVRLISYDQTRRPFSHCVSVTPLKNAFGEVTLVRATSTNVLVMSTASGTCASETPRKRHRRDYSLLQPPPSSSVDMTLVMPPDEMQKLLTMQPDELAEWLAGDDLGDWLSSSVNPEVPLVHPSNHISLPPNSVSVITEATYPHHIVWASESWLSLCGFTACEIAGRAGLKCIQGPGTNRATVAKLMEHVRKQEPVHNLQLINYDKTRTPFSHRLSIVPLQAPDGTMYLKATSSAIYRRQTAELAAELNEFAENNCWGDAFEGYFSSFEAMSAQSLVQ